MSLLYKDKQTITCDISQEDGIVTIVFYSDGGKFGTYETLDELKLTPEMLLNVLQGRFDS